MQFHRVTYGPLSTLDKFSQDLAVWYVIRKVVILAVRVKAKIKLLSFFNWSDAFRVFGTGFFFLHSRNINIGRARLTNQIDKPNFCFCLCNLSCTHKKGWSVQLASWRQNHTIVQPNRTATAHATLSSKCANIIAWSFFGNIHLQRGVSVQEEEKMW